jgi:uncharacterized membrane protein YsdA (DUF1294 family)
MTNFIIWFYLIINLCVFLIYGWDKLAAKKNWQRTPEHILLLLGLLGGAVGGLLGMLVWNHKTRKIKFWLVNILAIPLHICLWFGIYSVLENFKQ